MVPGLPPGGASPAPTKWMRGMGMSCWLRVVWLVGVLILAPALAMAQGLDSAALLRAPTDTWPTYNGDYSGRRYSTLDQINAGNVGSLTLAWMFQTRVVAIKSTPLLVDGFLRTEE